MEGAAVGHACYLSGVPFAVVRCISDGADDSGGMDYDTFVGHAARRCAKITLGLIDRIGARRETRAAEPAHPRGDAFAERVRPAAGRAFRRRARPPHRVKKSRL